MLKALEAARSLGNLRLVGRARLMIGGAYFGAGKPAEARAELVAALEIFEAIGAERDAATAANTLAEQEFFAGNCERAIQLSTTLIASLRTLGYVPDAMFLCNLAAYLIV